MTTYGVCPNKCNHVRCAGYNRGAATNAVLGELPVGALVRLHRSGRRAFIVDKHEDGRVWLHDLFMMSREISYPAATPVWVVRTSMEDAA